MEGLLPENRIRIIKLVRDSGGEFESRLAEKGDGDKEFLQWGVPDGFALTEEEFINLLHELETNGYLESSGSVHPYDSSEYVYKWKTTRTGDEAAESD
jgi:hypothetical protein